MLLIKYLIITLLEFRELSGKLISKASDEAIAILNNCLHFLLLLEAATPSMLTSANETLRLTRFICIFLTGALKFVFTFIVHCGILVYYLKYNIVK